MVNRDNNIVVNVQWLLFLCQVMLQMFYIALTHSIFTTCVRSRFSCKAQFRKQAQYAYMTCSRLCPRDKTLARRIWTKTGELLCDLVSATCFLSHFMVHPPLITAPSESHQPFFDSDPLQEPRVSVQLGDPLFPKTTLSNLSFCSYC